MKTVKINYADFFPINKETYLLTEVMRRFCNPVISDQPDILFYSCLSADHMGYQNCLKVYFTGENVHPDFNECDYAIACPPMTYGNRYLQLPPFVRFVTEQANQRSELSLEGKTRFCNFIYSNDNPLHQGAVDRIEFCKLLSRYKQVDCPGKVLHNMTAPELEGRFSNDFIRSKTAFIRQYKFTIAWENSFGEGYTTEKLADPLMAGSVPIYCGYLPDSVNPDSVIDISRFSSYEEAVDYIKYLDNTPEAYTKMLQAQPLLPSHRFGWRDDLALFLKQIVDSNGARRAKSPTANDSVSIRLRTYAKANSLHARLKRLIRW